MTAFIWNLGREHLHLLCDTLLSDPVDRRPVGMTSKALLAAHLPMLVCGVGLARVVSSFFIEANDKLVARDVVEVSRYAPEALRQIHDREVTAMAAVFAACPWMRPFTTVYTFGWSWEEQSFTGFKYRSDNNFEAERIRHGGYIVPYPRDASGCADVGTVEKMAALLRHLQSEDRATPRLDRAVIGGDMLFYSLQLAPDGQPAGIVQRMAPFPEAEADWAIIRAKLPINRTNLTSQLFLAANDRQDPAEQAP